MNLHSETHIRTFSGLYIDPFEIKPEDIKAIDIAHGLSHICRFGGHTSKFYSVAEHSCDVYREVFRTIYDPTIRLAALLHDAAEAYLLDIPAPVKKRLPGYAEAEQKVAAAIARKFGFDPELFAHPEIKRADILCLEKEWAALILTHDQQGKACDRWAKHNFMGYLSRYI